MDNAIYNEYTVEELQVSFGYVSKHIILTNLLWLIVPIIVIHPIILFYMLFAAELAPIIRCTIS